ncbi:MAG: hypothetical protein AB1638_12030 [Nitrospirota bacterium]
MKSRVFISFMVLAILMSTGARAQGPVAVSPGSGSGEATITQECPTFSWSEGRAFRVDTLLSAGLEDAVKGSVNEYLKNEWKDTEAYSLVTGEIKEKVLKEVKEEGVSAGISIMGNEGDAQGNTYYGTGAGASLDGTGWYNAFFGYNAGYNTTGGDYNTFIGYSAGLNNTTGNYNTFIGRAAGYSNQTGIGNVFLGYGAGYNETGSDKLYIDNSSTSTPLIYGEFG